MYTLLGHNKFFIWIGFSHFSSHGYCFHDLFCHI